MPTTTGRRSSRPGPSWKSTSPTTCRRAPRRKISTITLTLPTGSSAGTTTPIQCPCRQKPRYNRYRKPGTPSPPYRNIHPALMLFGVGAYCICQSRFMTTFRQIFADCSFCYALLYAFTYILLNLYVTSLQSHSDYVLYNNQVCI